VFQPVQQLGAVARNHVELRAVHVAVDEARQDQSAAMVVLRPRVVGNLRTRLHRNDLAAVDQQPVVGPKANGRRVTAPQSGADLKSSRSPRSAMRGAVAFGCR